MTTTTTNTAQFNYEFEESLKEVAEREAQKLQAEGFTGIATFLLSHEIGDPTQPVIQLQPGTGVTADQGEFYELYPEAGDELYMYLHDLEYPAGYSYAYALELTANAEENGQFYGVIY